MQLHEKQELVLPDRKVRKNLTLFMTSTMDGDIKSRHDGNVWQRQETVLPDRLVRRYWYMNLGCLNDDENLYW